MIKPFGNKSKLDTYVEQARRIRNAASDVEAGAALFSIIMDYLDDERRTVEYDRPGAGAMGG